jgi:hypothetical protein
MFQTEKKRVPEIFPGGKVDLHVPIVLKCESLEILYPSWPVIGLCWDCYAFISGALFLLRSTVLPSSACEA